VLRLSGPGARKLLQSGAPIDLDPKHFGPASSASTSIAHIAVVIWRSGSDDCFDLAFYRSYRESLEHWLSDAGKSGGKGTPRARVGRA
jgi:methylglutamate dehydrogenase subunit D